MQEAVDGTTVAPGTLPERGLRDFADALAAHQSVRIGWRDLWAAFAVAFPRRPSGSAERAWLLAALLDAEERRVIDLPTRTGRRWDRHAKPSLPLSVDRVRPMTASPSEDWRGVVWHPELQWVPGLPRLTTEEVGFLRRVHEGLVRGAFRTTAPFKHRSLALTGDEKRLAELVKGRLFEAGRLTLAMLGAEREVPPLAWTVVRDSAAPRVLIFENAGPSDLAIRLLRECEAPAWDVVAYGGGRPFGSSVVRLTTLRPSSLGYVGDLDPDGVAIATAAAATAKRAGLPILEPAPGFHTAMLEAARKLGAPDGWLPDPEKQARMRRLTAGESSFEWLPSGVDAELLRIARKGRRIPEEALGPEQMRRLVCRRDPDLLQLP